MQVRLQREIEKLKKQILTLGATVEERVHMAVQAINDRDASLAQRVIDGDAQIDEMEVELEEECLKILALHQPVAIDLRFLIAVLKINNDLERIGDLAMNISERALSITTQNNVEEPFNFPVMSKKVKMMLKKSLDSLVNMDSGMARDVSAMDDEVDEIHRQMYDRIRVSLQENPEKSDVLIGLLSVSRHLERIGDLATNIAEDVIYMIEGQIVRHNPKA